MTVTKNPGVVFFLLYIQDCVSNNPLILKNMDTSSHLKYLNLDLD